MYLALTFCSRRAKFKGSNETTVDKSLGLSDLATEEPKTIRIPLIVRVGVTGAEPHTTRVVSEAEHAGITVGVDNRLHAYANPLVQGLVGVAETEIECVARLAEFKVVFGEEGFVEEDLCLHVLLESEQVAEASHDELDAVFHFGWKHAFGLARNVTSPVACLNSYLVFVSDLVDRRFELFENLILGVATYRELLPEFERKFLQLSDKQMGLRPKNKFDCFQPACSIFTRQLVEQVFHRSSHIGKSDIRACSTHGQFVLSWFLTF